MLRITGHLFIVRQGSKVDRTLACGKKNANVRDPICWVFRPSIVTRLS